MEFAGIITEYDPFHNGHAAQLAAVRQVGAKCIAVCMSSGAVQRGGVPILPDQVRARAALEAGADLVVALPAPYACATAEQFAAAGVFLLEALGCDTLAFGAETPDAAALMQAASLLCGTEIQTLIRQNLSTGQTYAAARAQAADTLSPGTGALLRTPNNILAIEYCKAILTQEAAVTLLPLPRWGAAHGGAPGAHEGVPMASAGYLREHTPEEWAPFVPAAAMELYRQAVADGQLLAPQRMETALLALLRTMPAEKLVDIRGISEGLENRLAAAIHDACGLEDLYDRLKTKRYPHARLRRLVLDAALGIPEQLPLPPFLLVLGGRRAALSRLKQARLPVGTSLADLVRTGAAAQQIGTIYSRAVDLSSLCRCKIQPMGLAFTAKPVLL